MVNNGISSSQHLVGPPKISPGGTTGVQQTDGQTVTEHEVEAQVEQGSKVITLQIRGLHQATRKICEEQLLRVKGVISFTFNITKARCTVRVKTNVQAQKLCEAISETKIMSAQQIVKNESGEEVGAILVFRIHRI